MIFRLHKLTSEGCFSGFGRVLSSSNLKITIEVESPDKLSDNQNLSIWSRKSKIPIELNIDWRNRVGGVVTVIEH